MSPKYKVTYFKAKGRAEPIRVLLAYGKQEFEDNFIDREKWPQIKPTTPFGKVPVLEVDGKVLHQSASICRYLAKKFGLAGSSDEESLQIDMIVDTIEDVGTALRKDMNPQQSEEEKAAARKKAMKDVVPYYMTKFEEIVKANGGYFVNGKLSWADIIFACSVGGLSQMMGLSGLLDPYPGLASLQKKVFDEPNIKAWLNKRAPL
ncbi:glutathione S-transferase-like isoform X2 [Bacillus rossius redtenbacheri]